MPGPWNEEAALADLVGHLLLGGLQQAQVMEGHTLFAERKGGRHSGISGADESGHFQRRACGEGLQESGSKRGRLCGLVES